MDTQTLAKAYGTFYEKLTAQSTKEEYKLFFDENSEFEDPFQKVKGLSPIHNIFVSMYKKLYKPRFVVEEVVCCDKVAYLRWEFYYALSPSSKEESFTGISRVTFTSNAKVMSHIDYWDAAKNVYEKIPLLGSVLRLIKSKIHA